MNSEQNDAERRKLTFAQREGMAPLPEPLQVGALTKKFRNRIWHVIDSIQGTKDKASLELFLYLYQRDVLDKPHDEIVVPNIKIIKNWLRNLIINSEGYTVLTVIEFMLRSSSMPITVSNNISDCFDDTPYFVDNSSEPICIIFATSEEMKGNVKRSLDNINQSELIGSKLHLNNAAQELNNKNFPASIRESIHAVEAAARKIDPKASKNLGAALDSLEKKGMLKHPALKEGFKKLYGYTNDEEGIRHSLGDQKVANVGFDEAIFMYGACVSFVDYLVSKHKQASEK